VKFNEDHDMNTSQQHTSKDIYTLGHWISPHRIIHFGHLMWRYQADNTNDLYLYVNDYVTTLS